MWKPSITRSIGKTYNFQNQIFDSEKLHVESFIVTSKPIDNIVPLTLRVVYLENFDDDIFSIYPGDVKPLIQIIEGLKPLPYKLFLLNPNKSHLHVTLKTLLKKRVRAPFHTSHSYFMPVYQPQDNQALIDAVNANTAATVAAEVPELLDTESTEFANLGAALVKPQNDATRGVTVTTLASGKYRIYVGNEFTTLTPPTFTTPDCKVELNGANAVLELASGWNSNVWVVGNGLNGKVSVSHTYVRPVVPYISN